MRTTLYIPKGLNLKTLLSENRRDELCGDLIIDKLHYIIDHLYLNVVVMKRKRREFNPLHSQVLADVLGTRDAPKVKKALLHLGIIEVRRKVGKETYEAGECSKSYRFCKSYRYREFHTVPIRNTRFIELIERKRAKRVKRIIGNDAVRELVSHSVQNIDYDAEAAGKFLIETDFKSEDSKKQWEYAVQLF